MWGSIRCRHKRDNELRPSIPANLLKRKRLDLERWSFLMSRWAAARRRVGCRSWQAVTRRANQQKKPPGCRKLATGRLVRLIEASLNQ
jgi:hypothetical protein